MLLPELNKRHSCRVTGLHPSVLERFQQHNWKGNVRELRNVLERSLIVAGEGEIHPSHLPSDISPCAGADGFEGEDGGLLLRVGSTIADAEKGLILKTLKHTRNNKTRAAEILGISLKTLHNKLKEYG